MVILFFKRFALLVLFSISILFSIGQQSHFIYLQTENASPFYVKLNNKVISSSSNGYVIIPKLADSDYNMIVGFPKKEFPEENFLIKVADKDEGYLLKNFNDQGWGLFNLQSFAVTMGNGNVSQTVSSSNVQSDPFSKMLAKVVGDSTILQKNEPSVPKEFATKDVVSTTTNDSAIVIDSSAKDSSGVLANADSLISIVPQKDSIVASEATIDNDVQPLLLSPATRILKRKTKEGIRLIYVDYNMDKDDTIRIFMPYEKGLANAGIEKKHTDSYSNELKSTLPDTIATNAALPKTDLPADTTLIRSAGDSISENTLKKDTPTETADVRNLSDTSQKTVVPDTTQSSIVVLPQISSSSRNSDCKAFASNEDFLRLRKKMAAEDNDDDMIQVARKFFHSKCFTTEQIKNLSFLFLTDEGKYMFYETAYPFVSDSSQFSILQSQITDSYFLNRFKAMINK